ncbi:hypothetical protein [Mesorhizobium sp. M2C.T.Ca.TU.002.02.1.1]|uniref:hypothetical protein n=1 Tax=Mesorhizobium sp. M2C.T.Ca.TU.002.02.1.1 TaxID=2496788 RepID=UPI000FCA99FB|nr:hypothetical protein [Mesorhizobium sp. M2C.T.Ca.TU.002.02.1.1]RUU60624.1 hypothetical protein EOD07_03530 [Mesorhizobium sp. M2C.T.Ca.TU.002.02.1.1]RUU71826.1 hypothetical protein EOD04_01155 [Mesorhizobium sp. M2C.T.Ca.TU.009.01.2.1]
MRNLPVLLVALGGLAAFVLPAAAESDHESCAAASPTSSSTIDLEAIPMMSAAAPKAVTGIGDEECDGRMSASSARSERADEPGNSDD